MLVAHARDGRALGRKPLAVRLPESSYAARLTLVRLNSGPRRRRGSFLKAVVLAAIAHTVAAEAAAQVPPPFRHGVVPEARTRLPLWAVRTDADPDAAANWRLALGGVIGGAAGLGMGLGVAAAGAEGPAAAVLLVVGETVLLPLGVHVANHSRGNYGLGLLTSAGVAALGLFLAYQFGDDETAKQVAYISASAVVQLVAVVYVERKTADNLAASAWESLQGLGKFAAKEAAVQGGG